MAKIGIRTLRGARSEHAGRLASLPGVIGTGLGVKRRGGELVARAALIIFVDRKLGPDSLERAGRVPAFVAFKGKRIPTDVVELNAIRPELSGPPYFMSDQAEKGTVTAFARTGNDYLIITCAHCLLGPDKNPNTADPIGVWDGDSYVPVAETAYSVTSPGFGIPGNYGFVDAGFAIIKNNELLQRAKNAAPLAFAKSTTHGDQVIGVAPTGALMGTVDATELEVKGMRTDILVKVAGDGTHPGASGMLWRNANGAAVGMHAYGGQFGPASGSLYSLATAAARVMGQLSVELLDPV